MGIEQSLESIAESLKILVAALATKVQGEKPRKSAGTVPTSEVKGPAIATEPSEEDMFGKQTASPVAVLTQEQVLDHLRQHGKKYGFAKTKVIMAKYCNNKVNPVIGDVASEHYAKLVEEAAI